MGFALDLGFICGKGERVVALLRVVYSFFVLFLLSVLARYSMLKGLARALSALKEGTGLLDLLVFDVSLAFSCFPFLFFPRTFLAFPLFDPLPLLVVDPLSLPLSLLALSWLLDPSLPLLPLVSDESLG